MSLSPHQLAAYNRPRDENGRFLPSPYGNRSTLAKCGLKAKSKAHNSPHKGTCHPLLTEVEAALILALLVHHKQHHKSPIKHWSDAEWVKRVAHARRHHSHSYALADTEHHAGSWEAKLAAAKANAFSPSACKKKSPTPHHASLSLCDGKKAGNYGYNKDGSLFLVIEGDKKRSPSKHISPSKAHHANLHISPCGTGSHHKSPHKRDHHVNTEDYNCKTWAGCVYSAVAKDASSKGKKLEGGINGLHKILHYTKTHYPAIHEALVSDPDAWKRELALARKIRELYVERA